MTVHFRLSRILAALVQVVLIGLYLSHDYTKWGRLGRDAFLNYEAGGLIATWDRTIPSSFQWLVRFLSLFSR